jgi:hypothetical protein
LRTHAQHFFLAALLQLAVDEQLVDDVVRLRTRPRGSVKFNQQYGRKQQD